VNWLIQFLAVSWLPALVAFAVGLIVGSLVTRRQAEQDKAADTKTPDERIDALQDELKSARAMLEAKDDDAKAASKAIDDLDKAIKRANGRLKLIVKAIKRAKGGS
jgi:peptidoglycan hydrolase CwlO-like protein